MPSKGRGRARQTTDRLRDDIDQGRASDKVVHLDPAAAPLGTDDEAAGAPASQERIALARRQEVNRKAPLGDSLRSASQRTGRFGFWLAWIAVVVIAILLYAVTLA